jgi:hypothetical protein
MAVGQHLPARNDIPCWPRHRPVGYDLRVYGHMVFLHSNELGGRCWDGGEGDLTRQFARGYFDSSYAPARITVAFWLKLWSRGRIVDVGYEPCVPNSSVDHPAVREYFKYWTI